MKIVRLLIVSGGILLVPAGVLVLLPEEYRDLDAVVCSDHLSLDHSDLWKEGCGLVAIFYSGEMGLYGLVLFLYTAC